MPGVQRLLDIFEIANASPEWDALADANFEGIQEYISTWEMTQAGNDITIQLQGADGEDLEETCYLRVRLCDGIEYLTATSSQFSVTTGTVVETFTANKDEVIKSDSTGTIVIQLSLESTTTPPATTTAEAVTGIVRIGPPPVSARAGDYSNTITVG